MAEVGAYGLAVWAIVLIGFGFAFVTTIFVVIVSTVMRRMLIRSRRPLTFTVYPAVPRSPSKLHPSHARDSVILNDAALQRDTATMQEQNGPNGHAIESKREGDQKEDGDTVHMHTFENAYTTQTTTSRAAFTSAPTVENAGGRMSLDSSASEPPPPPRPRPPFSDATVAGSDFEYRMRYEPIAESAAAVVVESPSSDTQQSFLPSGAQRDSVKKRKKRTDSSGTSPQSRPLSRGSMAEMAANDQELDEEFKGLPTVKVDSKMLPPDAYVKNRYSSVLPAPDSLVPVHNEGTGSVYINANFVRGYEGKMKAYIATQAPMENTVDDFWSMVMEHNVSVIIMVTYLYEYGVEKCIQYWPERGTTRYGDTEIANLEEVHKEHYVRTTLKLRHITKKSVKTVRHYAFTAWPEHGMPRSSVPIRSFLRDINTGYSQGPVIVHCSAGVGRTGVVIAIDIGMKAIESSGAIDVVGIVSSMRQDRPGAVQTRSQYRFVYKALRDHMQEEKAGAV